MRLPTLIFNSNSRKQDFVTKTKDNRTYAARLATAANRGEVIKFSSDIRAENSALGPKWKDSSAGEKEQVARRLTNREMQFLFTKTSPDLSSAFEQARILGERIETSPLASPGIGERGVRAASVVLQNQPPEKVLRFSQELAQSRSVEDKKIGEVLETFSRAEIIKPSGKTTIEIQLLENALLGTETYKELLERFHPDASTKNEKFRFSSIHEKTLAAARIKGQDETIKNRQAALGNNSYAEKTAARIFQTECALSEDLSRVAQMQQAARVAQTDNTQILEKYASRAALKMENQKLNAPAIINDFQVARRLL